jgi:PEGA domain-containing protein
MNVKAAVAMAGMLAAGSAEAGARVVVRARPVFVARPAAVVVARPVLRVSPGVVVVERRGYGRLHVEVDPERARVYVDGRYVGRGDTTRTLRDGRHVVRVVLRDGREAVETVHVDAGHLTVARLDLNG